MNLKTLGLSFRDSKLIYFDIWVNMTSHIEGLCLESIKI